MRSASCEWLEWCARKVGTEEFDGRFTALQRMQACLKQRGDILQMGHLNLTTLPAHFPAHLKHLDLSENDLTTVNILFPAGLKFLELSYNQLTAIPANLPQGLTQLMLSGNLMTDFSAPLPPALTFLELSGCGLRHLDFPLPDRLAQLFLSDNQLSDLPDRLPSRLQSLFVGSNQITTLPESVPDTLRIFHLAGNQIETVPPSYREHEWSHLNLFDNPLTRLTDAEWSALRQQVGVTIGIIRRQIQRAETQAERMMRYLMDGLLFWLPAGSDVTYWRDVIRLEPGSNAFTLFLHRLSQTTSRSNSHFKTQVGEWLRHLGREENRPLREITFALARETTETCVDRVTLAYNKYQMLALADRVERGQFDHSPAELYALGRGLHRLQLLEEIASKKVRRLLREVVASGRAARLELRRLPVI